MDVDFNNLGIRIKYYRTKMDLKQNKLAEMMGVEPAYISRIEKGQSKMSLSTFVVLANALGVTANDLLCDNLVASENIYAEDLSRLLSDCTAKERKFIIMLAHDVKTRIRETKQFQPPENKLK